jgi:hypothetical protein
LRLRLLLAGSALLLCLLLLEALLHAMPRLLPGSFRERFPPHGIEFFHPGLLDRTPLTSVPLPYGAEPYAGPPPHDLIDRNVAPTDAASIDRAATPHIVLPTDRDGLPNAERHAQADLVLVGDSFLVYGAQTQPPGLVPALAAALATKTLNLGVSGTGPDQARSLLHDVGLPARPKLVLWFFFGGNDGLDAEAAVQREQQGLRTWGDLLAGRRVPAWIVPSLLASFCTAARNESLVEAPLPGLPATTATDRLTWFHPDYARVLALGPELLLASQGWHRSLAALRAGHADATTNGARFVCVFVPSKEQVHLPHVHIEAATLLRYVGMQGDADAMLAAAMQNRGLIETSMEQACREHGIAFWSCTPALERFARDGDSGYYATDTHWHARGQNAVAAELATHLRAAGHWPP